jgi:phosphopantothenoylcysteine decarboxylase / phosphopantothenate---cysteine ligase
MAANDSPRRVVLGVGGGIAAYKSAELARLLAQREFRVQCVMTEAATQFITPLTLASLTGQKVITGLFAAPEDSSAVLSSAIEHINVALENDLLVIAPATADVIARLAHGLANDFLTTLYLAFTGPVVIAPAMNTNMWNHVAVRENLARLRERGHAIVGPGSGELACGMVGAGRMAESLEIADAVSQVLHAGGELRGENVLITAGPTQEAIDPVRVITNRSSGKMGYALAAAAARRGAKVTVVSGPVHLPAPAGVEIVPVESAAQMHEEVIEHLAEATIFMAVAAVADYRPAAPLDQKMKKTAARLALELEPTTDILAEVGRRKENRIVIGFAAETQNLAAEGKRKLESKNADMIVANLVGQDGTGFEGDQNEVVLITHTAPPLPIAKAPKRDIAERILDQIPTLRLRARGGA